MKGFVYRVAVAVINVAAVFIRLFVRQRDEILLISCQGDEPTQDILDLAAAIRDLSETRGVKVMSGRMERSAGGAFSFTGKLLSMLRHLAAAKVVVLDAYCPAVSIPGKIKGQTVVQIWHAPEAIKKFSLQIVDTPAGYDSAMTKILKMHRNYDYILCPSDATRPFFAEAFGYPESAFIRYGPPVLDRIGAIKRSGAGEAGLKARAAIYEKYPEMDCFAAGATRNDRDDVANEAKRSNPLIIVYAPTFRDGTEVDTDGLVKAFEKAFETAQAAKLGGYVFVLKLHPLDAVKNACIKSNSDKSVDDKNHIVERPQEEISSGVEFSVIIDNAFPLIDWYTAADIIITDYSGAAVEAAAAGIASYYYIYDVDEYIKKRGLNVDLRDEVVGKYAYTDADALAGEVLKDFAAEGGCLYDYKALLGFAEKYVEVPLVGNTQRLAQMLAEKC